MILKRTFEATDGFYRHDSGETPKSGIIRIVQSHIEDRGEVIMDDDKIHRRRAKEMAKLLMGPNILEIGYGLGLTYKEATAHISEHTVCDVDPDVFTIADTHHPDRAPEVSKRVVGDYLTVFSATPNRTYNSILLDVERSPRGLAECRRLLKPGGYLVPHIEARAPNRLPNLQGFTLDTYVEYEVFVGNPNYKRRILRVLKQQGHRRPRVEANRLEVRHIKRETLKMIAARYKK